MSCGRDMKEYRGKVVKEAIVLGWIDECMGVLSHNQAP
jgi:hypothetical protein